jgi:hypothetical protein
MTNEEFAVSCSRLAFVGSRASFSSSSSILGRVGKDGPSSTKIVVPPGTSVVEA